MIFNKNELVVEPSRVHSIYFIKSLNIANTGRTVANPPAGCARDSTIYRTDNKTGTVIPYATDITKKVVFKPGYNCQMYQRYGDTIIINGAKGQGANLEEAQESEIPLYEGEEAPSNSPFLSGGIPCNRTIKAINGINNTNIPLIAGAGIDITANGNAITVSIIKEQLPQCTEDERDDSRTSPC